MPLFEFDCLDCKRQFELLVGVGAQASKKPACPSCDSLKVNKRFSRFGVRSGNGGGGQSGGGCGPCASTNCGPCKS
jgi:putative FmdB family regulatory protein